jgi:hypothetical protein
LKEFSKLTLSKDDRDELTRLTLLVDPRPAFTLAKLYEMIRNFSPASKKQFSIFKDMDKAMQWLSLGAPGPSGVSG